MPRKKNKRKAAQRAKLRLATVNGKKLPEQFRRDNPHIKSHTALALAYALQK